MLLTPAISAGNPDARSDLLLVHIQRRWTLNNRFHPTSQNSFNTGRRPGGL